MNCIKSIGKYILVFSITLIILFSSLTITSCIPKSMIEENIKESASFLKEYTGIKTLIKGHSCSVLHYYADSVLLNIIYCINSNNPIESTLWCYFYQFIKLDLNNDFVSLVENDKQPNEEYLRYWHGSMVIIRPLLTVFNLEQIYILNTILLFSLAIALFIMIFKRSVKLSVIYIISMVMIAFPIVPFCLEYTWTFYIMLITSIIALCIEKKGDKSLNILFLLSGMITCFLDFLSTEIITLFVPLLLVLIIRKKENRLTSLKNALLLIFKAGFLWSIGYVGMWVSKWILATVILNINVMDFVWDHLKLRINEPSTIFIPSMLYTGSLIKNLSTLFPLYLIDKDLVSILVPTMLGLVILLFTDWKNIKRKWFPILLLIIALTPYLRYLILANHSFFHSFFTFRSQIISIIAIGWALTELLTFKNIIAIKEKIKHFKKEKL